MAGYLLKGCAAVVTEDGTGPFVRHDVDLLTDGPAIRAIGPVLDNTPRRPAPRSSMPGAGSSIRGWSTPTITSFSVSYATGPSLTGQNWR